MTVVVVVTSFSTSMEQACITSTTSTNLAAWNLLFFPPYRLTYGRQQKWYLYAVTKEFVERQQVGCATL